MTDRSRTEETAAVKVLAQRAERSRWPRVTFVFVVGCVLTLLLFQAVRRGESQQAAFDFRRDASDSISAFRVSLIHTLDSVVALGALYASNPDVDRAAFHAFTNEHLLEEPGVVFLGWAPRVPQANRDDFERTVRGEPADSPALAAVLARFRIFEAESDEAETATPRDEYFPVLFAEPSVTLHTLGFDVASDPVQRAALMRARQAGRPAASERAVIRPDQAERLGVTFFVPVYAEGSPDQAPARLRGFVMGMFEVAAIVVSAMNTLEPRGIDMVVLDMSATPDESLLYFHESRALPGGAAWTIEEALDPSGMGVTETVLLGDREWLIACRPATGYVASRQTSLPLVALIAGVLMSGGLAALYGNSLSRESEASRYARRLLIAKEDLEREAEERERASRGLRKAQETQQRILDSLPLNVYLKDSKGRIQFINTQGLEFLGRELQEVVGKTDFDLFPAHVAEELQRVDRQVLAGTGTLTHEEHLEIDGRTFDYLSGKTPIQVEGWDELHVLGFSIDMTEIKEAQAALTQSEHRFRQLVENMSSGVAVYEAVDEGLDFVFRDYNGAAEQIDGRSRLDVIGKRLTEAFPGAEEMGLLELLRQVYRTGEPQSLPSAHYEDDRLEGWRENYVYRLPSGEVVAIYNDISERKRLEADLLHAQKMEAIGRLAGGIAHDFNNLLQVVAGSCDLLLSRDYDRDEQQEMLQDLRIQAKRGVQLVRRLLVFSRRESSAAAPIDLAEVVRSAESLVRRLLKENIDLSVEFTDTPLPIVGDEGQIEQVLMNLVVNAADAMPEGGNLWIRGGAMDPGYVWFSVTDSGPGIAAEIVDKVFEPYFTTKSAARGTGLGLAVVDGIVSLHDGRIEVDNRPGEGVTVKVVLPRCKQPAELEPPEPKPASPPKGQGERVLVVEDQEPVRAVMKTMLTSLGYEVTLAADGAEARQSAETGEFDLLVSDIVLPDTTGVELAEELRARNPALGLLLVSGYAEESVRQRAEDIRFLQKPFRLADLAEQVEAALHEISELAG